MFAYPVTLTTDSNGHVMVSFADVPEALTEGETRDAALMQAADALETALGLYIDDWRELPAPSAARGRPLVRPSLIGTMKLGLYQTLRLRKLRKTDLARRMGGHLPQIDRLLDLGHSSRVEQLEAAFTALDARVNVELELELEMA
jgi:antitoxin HicB